MANLQCTVNIDYKLYKSSKESILKKYIVEKIESRINCFQSCLLRVIPEKKHLGVEDSIFFFTNHPWNSISSRVGIKPGFYHKAQPGGFYEGGFWGFYVGFINMKVYH